ncbi:hypothetical protein EON67_06780 [archaeon]|nr:MAG: hypothetical protein EON67_06780 [archaeon]
MVKVEIKGAVGIITLNRPKALNALNSRIISEINAAAAAMDKDAAVGAIVLTGSERAFAAGADIKEMATKQFVEVYSNNMFSEWADLTKIRKPVRVPPSARTCACPRAWEERLRGVFFAGTNRQRTCARSAER